MGASAELEAERLVPYELAQDMGEGVDARLADDEAAVPDCLDRPRLIRDHGRQTPRHPFEKRVRQPLAVR